MQEEGNVLIGIPWRDRAWIAPLVLDGIKNIRYPLKKIGLRFIVHNSTDETLLRLREFEKENKEKFRYIDIWKLYNDTPPDNRMDGGVRKGEYGTIWIMQILKNLLMDTLLYDEDYFLYMDSDILLEPETLSLLMRAEGEIVAGLCKTSPDGACFNFLDYNKNTGQYERLSGKPLRLQRADYVAGLILFRREICEKIKFKYYQDRAGEDEGIARYCRENNIPIWIEPAAWVNHVMSEEELRQWECLR